MRDETKFTLWWESSDEQTSSMFFGNFDSEAEAMAGIPAAEREYRDLCNAGRALIDSAHRWEVDPPTEYATERDKDAP